MENNSDAENAFIGTASGWGTKTMAEQIVRDLRRGSTSLTPMVYLHALNVEYDERIRKLLETQIGKGLDGRPTNS